MILRGVPWFTSFLGALIFYATPISAFCDVDAPQLLPDQIARTLKLGAGIRCPVCQGQPVTESRAPLARDILCSISRAVAGGESDEQIQTSLSKSYGENITLMPSFQVETWALWIGPWIFLGLIGLFLMHLYRRQQRP